MSPTPRGGIREEDERDPIRLYLLDTRNQLVLPPVHDLLHILRRSQLPPTLTRPEDIKKKWRVRYVWEDGSSGHGGRRTVRNPPGHGQLFYFLEWLDLPLDSSVLHLR